MSLPEPLRIGRRAFRDLMSELAARGRGDRESGAFLLAHAGDARRVVRKVVFFDDLDPDCLQGAISLRGSAYAPLWDLCRREGLRVVADVHTHPSDWVQQSQVDRENPMVSQTGHVAVIVPRFAQGRVRPRDLGVHVYAGDYRWRSWFGRDAARLLRRRWW